MYIVRWLMGHPIIAIWFLGAIAILLSISNSGDKKELHGDDHSNNQEQVVTTDSTKSIDTPPSVTSGLIESDEKKATVEESVKAEVETEVVITEETETTETVKVEEPSGNTEHKDAQANLGKSEEVVTKATIDSTEVTSRSYPSGLDVSPEASEIATKTDVEVVGTPGPEETQPTNDAEQAKDTEQTKDAVPTKDAVQTKDIVEETAGKTGNQTDVAAAANQATSTIEETPKPEVEPADSESIQDLGQSSTEEMLLMAREAYWNNGLEEASQIYTQLIELEPTVIEHRGELGNVYWRQGYPKKAAQLYSEIAIPMIEQGKSERVANMIGFIGLFYPDRAAEIHKKLQAAKN